VTCRAVQFGAAGPTKRRPGWRARSSGGRQAEPQRAPKRPCWSQRMIRG